ncbi:PREDICTED: 3'(2'),5'-bisphosphate nucleotidase 1 isoform X1 [Myotis brandtii]|uniref:3'(2'),5'-bisphosphate nucleotidase 1 isoform X1 n=1 Tax=Myotis brandtii TaxID=109478 RepID=UPI0003BBC4DB|nr:PREDICTED: 3'(2'),5'-bisphosphate nucleotidase 1 isoform X1 [Myotis brandtii]XP_005879940.1 PREDICTED: 3'(2'),5'-bisphosphate nucleotidase 1 isoform X1 [Myotis brandtii]XP_005879941.1 PREDICTED: 3'(2'),5'-bisphosphate nucleotidase 1 isoform X1 [Myotis brandtii]XP_005879942.1 PREDICTED: 3'(2'),5'-bisphosphate nucleotidase 1 isoform X1 [Myotis brandtii]XP_005879943.1 PREDICTED: 3'(2'),5'-bisphosphate nucleotidase 1 isoform X1 [Myotis brandtii]
MASGHTVLMRLVASAYSIAQKAGTIVRRVIAEGDLGIVEKTSPTDLQTKADRLAQMSICSSLARKFPKLTIIGEEDLPSEEVDQELIEDGQWEEILRKPCPSQYSTIKEEDLVVWVDPLDGTKEYTEGLLDNVTVLIGIAYEGKAIAGVINQPYYNYQNNEKQKLREHRKEAKVRRIARFLAPLVGSKEAGPGAALGRTIWGVLGLGAFGFQLKEVPAGKHIITTTRSHSNKLVTDCVTAMNPDDVLRVGGAGNKIIQLIEGKASAYVFASPGCKKWDTCAPEVILHAVGGKLTDVHGNALQYDKEVKHMNSAGVLASLRNHDYYASRVPESVKNALVP